MAKATGLMVNRKQKEGQENVGDNKAQGACFLQQGPTSGSFQYFLKYHHKLRTKQAFSSRGYGGNISCLNHHATILNCVPGYNEIMLIKAVCNSI